MSSSAKDIYILIVLQENEKLCVYYDIGGNKVIIRALSTFRFQDTQQTS